MISRFPVALRPSLTCALLLLVACGSGKDEGSSGASGGAFGVGGLAAGGTTGGAAITGGFGTGGALGGTFGAGGLATGGATGGAATTGGFGTGGALGGTSGLGGAATGGAVAGSLGSGGDAVGGAAGGTGPTGGWATGGAQAGAFGIGGGPTGGVATGGVPGAGGGSGGVEASGGASGGTSPTGGAGGDATGGTVALGPLVSGLEISKLSLYQTVEIPLMQDWAEIADRPADIAQDKDALLRVFVTPQAGWTARTVKVAVELSSSSGDVTLTAERQISGASSDGNLNSTLNVEIPAAELSGNATYRVSLTESGAASGSGDTTRAQWPAGDPASFGERSLGGGLKLHIVPIRYDADGSGRVPDTSEPQLALIRETVAKLYPVPLESIELTVEDEMPWDTTVANDGSGWEELLYGLVDHMDSLDTARDIYYFGLFEPDESEARYCWSSCVAGLAFVTDRPDGFFRINAGIGLGYPGEYTAETVVHEVGHLHGRNHSPCGTTDGDPRFPYSNGGIGSWGYDLFAGQLKDPDDFYDFMGYCPNIWASDYTYQALFDWIVATNGVDAFVRGAPARWQSLRLNSRGDLTLGPDYDLVGAPSGIEIDVEWLDANFEVIEQVVGYLTPFDALPGGIVLVQPPTDGAVYVRVDGSTPVAL
jgi:hypothetical protein